MMLFCKGYLYDRRRSASSESVLWRDCLAAVDAVAAPIVSTLDIGMKRERTLLTMFWHSGRRRRSLEIVGAR